MRGCKNILNPESLSADSKYLLATITVIMLCNYSPGSQKVNAGHNKLDPPSSFLNPNIGFEVLH